jgi:hypothetical protein
MPPLTGEQTPRKVIQQWFNGLPRDKIAEDSNIGTGTVSSIIANYKIGLDNSDFEYLRELAVAARKQGLSESGLAVNLRLYNYFRESGASENTIGSFIANVSSSDMPPEKLIELVNQLFNISKAESIPLDQVPEYINKKLQEKQKINERVREAMLSCKARM